MCPRSKHTYLGAVSKIFGRRDDAVVRCGAARRVTAIAKAILEITDRVFALIKRAQLRERDLRGGVSVENSRISL